MRERRSSLKSSRVIARLSIATVVAAAAVLAISNTASAAGWAIVSSPNQGGSHNLLFGAACTSATSCVAVGYWSDASSVTHTLIENWNGTAWSITPSPNQGTTGSALSGVACTSASSCTAVGDYLKGTTPQTLIETWNGTSWSITPSTPNQGTGTNYLYDVACASSTSCLAVGFYVKMPGFIDQTLAETWNGSTWSLAPSPSLGTGGNRLYAVACTSATSCTMVGNFYNGTGPSQTLVEFWNGSSWSVTPNTPNQGTGKNYLYSVSCVAASNCVAAGTYYNASGAQTLAESWNGTAWSISISPNKGTGANSFADVACTSSTRCVAAGTYYTASKVAQTLVESWNGTAWSISPSPNQGSSFNNLNAIACASATSCVAVGAYLTPTTFQTLTERWNGASWSITASPNAAGKDNSLSAVSCPSSTSCIAVGAYFNGTAQQTLVESWNGATWTAVASPNQGSSNNGFNGVACTSASSCVAVGTYANTGVSQTLIERWNGSTWTILASPNQGTSFNYLNAVACTSATSCVAVGNYFNTTLNTEQTLTESWSGGAWTITTSPNPSTTNTALDGVTCTSSTSCTAVGNYVSPSVAPQTLVEHWNGTSWAIVASPDQSPSLPNFLTGVACTSATSCTAVGAFTNASNVLQTLVVRWNGTSWSITPSPNQGSSDNYLSGIACPTATSCVAAGYESTSMIPRTLLETWNGTTWTIVASPNQGSSSNTLSGVACTASTSCSAVGAYTNAGVSQTLIETRPAATVVTSITVTSPTLSASWARGSTHAITWSSTGSPGANVKIQLLKSGVLVNTITTSVPTSAHTFTWKLPTTLTPATTYQVKIVSTTSASVFGLSGKFSIT